ncbi:hypothetical protein DES41_102106 [Pseudorhodoferax soli]|uniref:Uncharacterized protein n=1 Tax=Pseudorhodoferax soli TaxID=545864 RepID=A0A368Y0R0_9BURK|nr:hypothetical protein DES41_102106 [Pseudorhodoferax soli]
MKSDRFRRRLRVALGRVVSVVLLVLLPAASCVISQA